MTGAVARRRLLGHTLNPASDEAALGQSLASLDAQDWRILTMASLECCVAPAFSAALETRRFTALVPQEDRDALAAARDLHRQMAARYIDRSVDLARDLAEIGIEPVFLKGMAQLLLAEDAAARTRMVLDIDVLVPPDRVFDAWRFLVARGYREVKPRKDTLERINGRNHHLPRLATPCGKVAVELHRSFFAGDESLLPAAEILASARSVIHFGLAMKVPTADHRLTLALAHCALRQMPLIMPVAQLRDGCDVATSLACDGADPAFARHAFAQAGAEGAFDWSAGLMERVFGVRLMPRTYRPPATARLKSALIERMCVSWNPQWRINRFRMMTILLVSLQSPSRFPAIVRNFIERKVRERRRML